MKGCKIIITRSGVHVEILRHSQNIFDMRVLFDNKSTIVVMVTIVQFQFLKGGFPNKFFKNCISVLAISSCLARKDFLMTSESQLKRTGSHIDKCSRKYVDNDMIAPYLENEGLEQLRHIALSHLPRLRAYHQHRGDIIISRQ